MKRMLVLIAAAAVPLMTLADEAENLALGKAVSSGVGISDQYGRASSALTDGNWKTDAYPGAFRTDYIIDLTSYSEGGDCGDKAFDVASVVIHWGHYGRHFPGTKRPDGSWAPAAYKADYVKHYTVDWRATGAENWQRVHSSDVRPTSEDAENVSVVRDPEGSAHDAGQVTTVLRRLDLKGVAALRIRASGGHWIGIYEVEAYGRASASN